MFKALRLSAFVFATMLLVFGGELSQAFAETFLVPQEQQMHALVNGTRASKGLPQLPDSDAIRTLARRQAQAMAAAGYIYHTPNLAQAARSASAGITTIGENVGMGPSVETIETAFLDSPKHYENIVDEDYSVLGVGGTSGDGGTLFFAQNFAAVASGQPAPAAAPRPVRTPAPRASSPVASAAGPAVASPTPAPAPSGIVARIPSTLDRFPQMAGTRSGGATAVGSSRPGGDPKVVRPTVKSVKLPATIGALLGRFFAKLAFWH